MTPTKLQIERTLTACLLLFCLFAQPAAAQARATLVIIIDDLGNHLETGKRAIALPGKLTMAFLPYTPNNVQLAELANAAGKEIILHTPMSNWPGKPLGPGALTQHMSEQELRKMLSSDLDSTPHIKGVSNHMGSQLTSMREPMEWFMEELSARNLYFVDSRTSVNTLAAQIASEYGIPNLSRQVFLDHEISQDAIHRQFQRLLATADREGVGIAIGHPYPETLEYLQQVLPTLEASGYQLAFVSEVLSERSLASRTLATQQAQPPAPH